MHNLIENIMDFERIKNNKDFVYNDSYKFDATAVKKTLVKLIKERYTDKPKIVRFEKDRMLAEHPDLKARVDMIIEGLHVHEMDFFDFGYMWFDLRDDVFKSGAWFMFESGDTWYWVARPTVHMETTPGGVQLLHNATGPALESDIADLYFWHGVLVPAHVILNPIRISVAAIKGTTNAEVRRVLIERYGYERYLRDAKLTLVDTCADDHPLPGLRTARLFRDNQSQVILLDMRNSTPEADGSVKRYVLSVDGNAYNGRAGKECLAAMASTWRRQSDYSLYFPTPEDYWPMAES
jgi:hypothetical protein